MAIAKERKDHKRSCGHEKAYWKPDDYSTVKIKITDGANQIMIEPYKRINNMSNNETCMWLRQLEHEVIQKFVGDIKAVVVA